MKNPRPFNLQLFAEGVDEINALDLLLEGKTQQSNDPPPSNDPPQTDDTQNTDADDPAAGGDPNLDDPGKDGKSSNDPPKDQFVQDPKINAVMAKLRTEAAQSNKVINELAKALGITETDPNKKIEVLLDLAYKKIAAANNAPVELVKELDQTKTQMLALQAQQNQITAREKFFAVQQSFGLTQEELADFAKALDDQGIIVANDPSIDLNYLYYSLNSEKLMERRIQAAVEAALKTSNTADEKGSKPPKQSGSVTDNMEPPKVNSVSALDAILSGK